MALPPSMSLGADMGGMAPPVQGLSMSDFTGSLTPPATTEAKPIDSLTPGSDKHAAILARLLKMFQVASSSMTQHHSRWQYQEQRVQAYVRLPDYERAMQAMTNGGGVPEPVKVIIPYTYATLHAAATYIATVLGGRKPMFQLTSGDGQGQGRARIVEQALQYNMDRSRGLEVIFQSTWDALNYGFFANRVQWDERRGSAISIVQGQRVRADKLKYAGNMMKNVDPYSFFPDPRVPIWQGNREGDFCFFRSQQSRLKLKEMELGGTLKFVSDTLGAVGTDRAAMPTLPPVASGRNLRIGTAGQSTRLYGGDNFQDLLEGTVRLIPSEWKLGSGKTPEIWKFSILNQKQIVQAQPLDMEHGMHPYFAAEPNTTGYEFGSLSLGDMISPFQDLMSWFFNSRLENVRNTLHNQFIYDPARVEVKDVSSPGAGKLIRLKKAAVGTPIDEAIKQLRVTDVTSGHVGDIQNIRMIADTISGVSDNLRGVQTSGGRRSATEARIFMQAGASRLGQMAVRMSAQGFSGGVEQMISNLQQFMPDEMWIDIAGAADVAQSTLLTPDMVMGDFNYSISDGTLPIDRQAMLETWKEILMGIMQDPQLRQEYSIGKVFEYVAELGGARNIDQFKQQQMPMPVGQVQPMHSDQLQGLAAGGGLMPVQLNQSGTMATPQ